MKDKRFSIFVSDRYAAGVRGPSIVIHAIIQLIACIGCIVFLIMMFSGCVEETPEPTSKSNVKALTTEVTVNAEGITVEQQNIRDRLIIDNTPGSIKHLYVISAYSGQVLIYSTVRGKVTSSGKRLSPTTVGVTDGNYVGRSNRGFLVDFNGIEKRTGEVLQDDGSYGTSIQYLYWWDSAGKYHQHYVSGGQILHISDQPIPIKNVVLNMELTTQE